MNSKDKSLLIDIFRKIPNKITCMVGDGQNDYDAMMTAHVGINLNKPVNMNTILCHFHPTDGSLFCISKIIRYGRVIYENIYLLGISSFLYALNIVNTLLILYYYDLKFVYYELDFMGCNYFILSIIAFSVKPDISIKSCLLFHNPSLLKCFLMVISIGNVIFNIAFTLLFMKTYSKNESLEKEKRFKIFGNYIQFMCYFQILGMVFGINTINFYRISHRKNFFFWSIMIILILFVSFIFCIFGYSIYPILKEHLSFEYQSKNVDTFDDRNKLISFSIFVGNVLCFYFFVLIMTFLFKRKAEKDYQKKNKIVINSIDNKNE
jgi:magnesium-transporting ATPase (P-type)